MAGTALRLITSRGEEVVLTRVPTGGMTASGDRANTEQSSALRGLMLPGDGEKLTDGRTIAGKVLLQAASPAPHPGNTLTFPSGSLNQGEWHVDEAKNLAPEGELVYSELRVSR